MSVRMRLSDGITFLVDAQYEQFRARVVAAEAEGDWLAIENEHGVTRDVNPRHIVYIEPETAVVPARAVEER